MSCIGARKRFACSICRSVTSLPNISRRISMPARVASSLTRASPRKPSREYSGPSPFRSPFQPRSGLASATAAEPGGWIHRLALWHAAARKTRHRRRLSPRERSMRTRLFGRVAAFAAAAVLAASAAQAVEQGDRAPAWMRVDFDDRPVMFPGVLEGRPAVLVFWATWCPYCRALMPYLEGIQADYADAGVKIIAINAKEDGAEDPKAYIRGLGFPLIAVQDGD